MRARSVRPVCKKIKQGSLSDRRSLHWPRIHINVNTYCIHRRTPSERHAVAIDFSRSARGCSPAACRVAVLSRIARWSETLRWLALECDDDRPCCVKSLLTVAGGVAGAQPTEMFISPFLGPYLPRVYLPRV